MKNQIILFLIILISFNLAAQDIIFTRTGEEIKSKVIEITPDFVKYKKFNNPEGPQYSIKKTDVLLIKYPNGTKDIFTNKTPITSSKDNTSIKENFPINKDLDKFKVIHRKSYILYDYQINPQTIFSFNSLYYYGLDFSAFTYISPTNKGMEKQLQRSFIEWNLFFKELLPIEKFPSLLEFDYVKETNTPIKTSYETLEGTWITSFPYSIRIEQVIDIVKNYKGKIKETFGIGFVLIIESFNEQTGMVTAIPTFFSIKTHEVLWASKIQEKAGREKNRDRWSYGLKRVLNTYTYKIFLPVRWITVD